MTEPRQPDGAPQPEPEPQAGKAGRCGREADAQHQKPPKDEQRAPGATGAPGAGGRGGPGDAAEADTGWEKPWVAARGAAPLSDMSEDAEVPGAADLPRLAQALRSAAGASPGADPAQAIPPRIDHRIAEAARYHLQHAHPAQPTAGLVARSRYWRWATRAALAAAAAAVIVLGPQIFSPQPSPLPAPDLEAGVTIVDAFNLARAIEAGQPVDPGWDVTGDGVVDEDDVQAIASRAVGVTDRDAGQGGRGG